MLETIATAISWLLIGAGSFFVVVGATGIVRMPDIFTRMHAAGILDTVGAGLMLTGLMFAAGLSLVSVKLLIILATILFTSPVATHALAQAALHAGLEPLLASKRVLGEPEKKPTSPRKPPEKRAPASTASATKAPATKAPPSTASATETAKTETGPEPDAATPSEAAETTAVEDETDAPAKARTRRQRRTASRRPARRRGASTRRGRGKPSNS